MAERKLSEMSVKAQANYNAIKKDLNLKNRGDIFEYLLENYNRESIVRGELSLTLLGLKVMTDKVGGININEQKIVTDAIKNSGHSLEKIAHDGVIQRAKYLNSIATKQAALENLSDEELKQKNFAGAANQRINNTIIEINAYNEKQPSNDTRIEISQSVIFKMTGTNRNTIRKFFNDYSELIDSSNKYNITHGNRIYIDDGAGVKVKANIKDLLDGKV